MYRSPQILRSVVAISLIVFLLAPAAFSQLTSGTFRKLLIEKTGLTAEELSALDRREIVVKILPVKFKQEIAVFGIVRLKDLPQVSMQAFRDSLDQNSSSDYSGGGKLSMPPNLQDLARLRFEDRDLEDLKNCTVGNCKVKLPASMIRSLTAEIDWNAADHKLQASNRLKQFMVEYARDYIGRGDKALIEYVDKRKPVNLAEDYRTLLEDLQIVNVAAPDLVKYLLDFPSFELPGAENTLDWSKVRSGLKPVISITHGTSYAKRSEDNSILFIATKQLYANHYIDASLTLSTLVQFGKGDSVETYLVFDNRSRSDALAGMFGDMVRGLTEKEAQKRVKELLQRSDHKIETRAQQQNEVNEAVEGRGIVARITDSVKDPVFVIVGALLILLIAAFILFRRRR